MIILSALLIYLQTSISALAFLIIFNVFIHFYWKKFFLFCPLLTILLKVLYSGETGGVVHPRLLHPPNLGPGEAAGAELEHGVIGLAGYQVVAPCDINMHRSGMVWRRFKPKLKDAKAAWPVFLWALLGSIFFIYSLTIWLTDWLTDRSHLLTNHLTDWLTDWLTDITTYRAVFHSQKGWRRC